MDGDVTNRVPPIVHVLPNGNYIIQGVRVSDAEALGQMIIPIMKPAWRCPRRPCGRYSLGRRLEIISKEQRDAYFSAYRRTALHLEMRDIYATDIERSRFQTWTRGEPLDPDSKAEWWQPWFDIMKANVEAGKPYGGCASCRSR